MMSPYVLSLLVASVCVPGVDVRVAADLTLDIEARNAPLSSVLECLSERAGFKTTIEPGSVARQAVTVSLSRRTPVQAVFTVLDGLRLNYAYTTDPSGSRVVLLIVSSRSVTAAVKPTPPTAPAGRPGARRDPQGAPSEPESGSPDGSLGAPVPPYFTPGQVPVYPEARPLTPLSLRDAHRIHVAVAPPVRSLATEAAPSDRGRGQASWD